MKNRMRALAAAALVMMGCEFLTGPDTPVGTGEQGGGNLSISFGEESGSGASRSISSGADLPPDLLAALRYTLTLTGPAGAHVSAAVWGRENFSVNVTTGNWRVDVSAYQGDALAGTGSLAFTVTPGNNSVTVPMYMSGLCYTITAPSAPGGTVQSNFSAAFPGTAIVLTASAEDEHVFKPGTFTYNDGSPQAVAGNSFTMPSGDITVSAAFVQVTRYVKAGGTGSGSSWDNASNDIQKMMDELSLLALDSSLAYGGPFIVKVGAGTYTPKYYPDDHAVTLPHSYTYNETPTDTRDRTFMLRKGVELRGGYGVAGEALDEAARKARFNADGTVTNALYKAVLSGDFNGDDSGTGNGENAYHVVLGVNIPATGGTVLDGLTISGGNGNANSSNIVDGVTIYRNHAGGIYNASSSPVLVGVTISGNRVHGGGGGGMVNDSSSPVLTSVMISGNSGSSCGGVFNRSSSPILINAVISGNSAGTTTGGGMVNDSSSPILVNTVISGNFATGSGGGGMENANPSSPILVNVTISGNFATGSGGGIFNNGGSPYIRNSVIWGNTAGIGDPGIYNISGSTPTIAHSIVQDSGSGSFWDTDGTPGPNINGGNNADTDPLFENLVAATAGSPTTGGDYRLKTSPLSPAIGAGSNGFYPPSAWAAWDSWITSLAGSNPVSRPVFERFIAPALSKDPAGNNRVQGTIDMGAYERQ